MQKKTHRITISLTGQQRESLQELADSTGIESTALIRAAVDGLLDYAAAHGGIVPMPLRFDRAWTDLKDLLDRLERTPPARAPRAAEPPGDYRDGTAD